MSNVVLVECRACDAIVAAETLAQYSAVLDPKGGQAERFTFARCPKCDNPLLVAEEFYGNERGKEVWSDPYRLYPPRDDLVGPKIPRAVRSSHNEALSCFKAQAFSAAKMMCRRTLEAACVAHEIDQPTLAAALAEMSTEGIIEPRMYEWADALRIGGNGTANGAEAEVSREDARDALEFTGALLEYLYTFRDKFLEFQKRRGIEAASAQPPAEPPTLQAVPDRPPTRRPTERTRP